MADNFFGFDTNFPSGNVLRRKATDDEFLTEDVEEEEYDALNDETFGQAANDDWEEAHEKLSELIHKNDLGRNVQHHDSVVGNDESQDEIVSKSISQLGLEDDLDDPAIMTIARNCKILGPLRSFRSSSPPPPAILETEDCGSPKTHSIWSTTPKDSGISSFLKSISHKSANSSNHSNSSTRKSSSDDVFITPTKAWRAEELEKDLLSSGKTDSSPSQRSWPQVVLNHQSSGSNTQLSPRIPGGFGQSGNKMAVDRMLTHEEVERQMHVDMRMRFPGNVGNFPFPHVMPPPGLPPPGVPAPMMSPIGAVRPGNVNMPKQSSPIMPLRPNVRPPLIGNNCSVPPDKYFTGPRMNMLHNQMPLRGPMPNLMPGLPPTNINMNHKLMGFPPRSISHPFLHKQFQFPMVIYNNNYANEEDNYLLQGIEDEYAGLMTQREKEWLIKIQLLQLKSENPYIEDYYYTTQVTRQCQKKYSETAQKGGGDAPELILPETTKHENKAFVPIQYEGSLGKLQAVSVNFPRKVLDITVTRPLEDDEGKVVSNQSLMKYRKLLLDIERLYRFFLEIEDEERRILAKPESESGQHLANIAKLKKDIYQGLCSENSQEDNFMNIMTVRKGRTLVMRVFKVFNLEQQLQCLVFLLSHLILILKRDQSDQVLVQHIHVVSEAIQKLTIPDLLKLGESLILGLVMKEKSGGSTTVFDFKFGSSIVCSVLNRADTLFSDTDSSKSDLKAIWSNIVDSIVACLSLSKSPLTPTGSSGSILSHLQKFATEKSKLDLVQKNLAILETDSKSELSMGKV